MWFGAMFVSVNKLVVVDEAAAAAAAMLQ